MPFQIRHSAQPELREKKGKKQSKSQKTSHSNSGFTAYKHSGSPKQLQQLSILYDEAMDIYNQSALAKTVEDMLRAKNRPRVTKAISLGLGSLMPSKDQQRRIKQLVLFMAIASHLTLPLTDGGAITLYAQDPTFTATDEAFLQSLGIHVLKTPSSSDLGEAGNMIDAETLVYSPFLTVATYKLLLSPTTHQSRNTSESQANVPILVSDDFNSLRLKWEKRTAEHRDVEGLIKNMKARGYQRRAVNGEGFWIETDRPFPMALYSRRLHMNEGRVPRLSED